MATILCSARAPAVSICWIGPSRVRDVSRTPRPRVSKLPRVGPLCGAASDPGPSSSGDNEAKSNTDPIKDTKGSNVDWDNAWTSFQRNVRSQVDSRTPEERGAYRPPPPKQRSAGGTARTPLQERIRQQETYALDIWTSEAFLKACGAGAVVLLVVFVFLIGPPPDDGRCTLPWC